MRPLAQSIAADFTGVDFVLTDMDDTLTHRGRLAASTYAALERLQADGIGIVPVTAAPAGWCDQMVRMWPVDAVIGENGGVSMWRTGEGTVQRRCWHDPDALVEATARFETIVELVRRRFPGASLAADQPFRLTSLAFERPSAPDACADLCALLRAGGATVTVNSLWVLCWLGPYDKLVAARRFMHDTYGIDVDAERERIVYVGDSINDAPMFRHFPRSVGVSTVIAYLDAIEQPPAWITCGPGGKGFVEVADAILAARMGIGS